MLHPVGPQPPSVYWRRRLLVLATVALVVVLIALTLNAVLGDGGPSAGTSANGTSHPPTHTPSAPHTSVSSHPSTTTKTTPAGSTGKSSAANTMPARCTAAQLDVRAVVGKSSYKVGDNPVLTLQVTNTGSTACVQNVADSQIVLRVYNGASRVWGSHDCKIEPGVQDRTLAPDKPAGFSIVWSGLTARPGCAGTRQRVGAGTYTLYAALSGHDGKAAQFTIK
jgi:hypothetical protein